MAWTTPITWADGGTPTANQFNQQIRDNFGESVVAKAAAVGDTFYASASATIARLALGSGSAKYQVSPGTLPSWSSALPHVYTKVQSQNIVVTGQTLPGTFSSDLSIAIRGGELWFWELNTYAQRGTSLSDLGIFMRGAGSAMTWAAVHEYRLNGTSFVSNPVGTSDAVQRFDFDYGSIHVGRSWGFIKTNGTTAAHVGTTQVEYALSSVGGAGTVLTGTRITYTRVI